MGDPTIQAPPLRPLGFGEIFDRAITLYLRNFWPFVGIMLVLLVPFAVFQFVYDSSQADSISQLVQALQNPAAASAPAPDLFQGGTIVLFLFVLLLVLIAEPFVYAAIAFGVARLYNERRVGFRACYEAALQRWPQVVGVTAMAVLTVFATYMLAAIAAVAFVAASFLLGKAAPVVDLIVAFLGVLGFFLIFLVLFATYAFALFAAVIEGKRVFEAIGSGFARVFNRREFWRAFVVVLCALLIGFFGSFILSVFALLAALVHLVWLEVAMQTLAGAIVAPYPVIVFAIYYYDVRVRREGLDLEMQLRRLTTGDTAL